MNLHEHVWTCPGTDQADLWSESWYFESFDGGETWQHGSFEDFNVHGCMTVEFGKICQETDIRIAEVKRDAYEFRPGIEWSSLKISKKTYASFGHAACLPVVGVSW